MSLMTYLVKVVGHNIEIMWHLAKRVPLAMTLQKMLRASHKSSEDPLRAESLLVM